MGVGLGLFATGILALCCGVSSINNEPMKVMPNTTFNNSGSWYDFHSASICPLSNQYGTLDSIIYYVDYFNIDDSGITCLGGYSIGRYHDSVNSGDSYTCYYGYSNNVNGSYVSGLVGSCLSDDADDFELFTKSNLFNKDEFFTSNDNYYFIDFNQYGSASDFWADFTTYDSSLDSSIYMSFNNKFNGIFAYINIDDGEFKNNFLWLNDVNSTLNMSHYEINFFGLENKSNFGVGYNYTYLPIYVDYDNSNYFYCENGSIYTTKETYNFSTDEEFPYNNDYLNGTINDIYYKRTLSFDEYAINGGTYYWGDFARGSDDENYKCFIVRTPLISNDYSTGYNQGYQIGYSDGNRIGYENGYRNGVNDTYATDNSFFHLFGAIADTPILMLRSLFDFDLFGINVLVAVLSLLTAIITAWVIRKFI